MNERNATASWSGYSHQGQVGLLIALRKLQEDGIDLSNHYVEFENTEDVAIYESTQDGSKNFISVHQVKAYYSDGNNTKSKYTSVLNDPFQGAGTKYLHTVVEIDNWITSPVSNNNSVERYPYSNTQFHSDTTEIEIFIMEELNMIFPGNPSRAELAYKRLSFELDNKIRSEHKNKASKNLYDIKFSLQEIINIINDQSIFESQGVYECRKIFYETFIEVITEEGISDDKRQFLEEGVVKWINDLDDQSFNKFLQYLNICELPKDLKRSQVIANKDGLEQVFFRLLVDVLELDPLQEENIIKYKKDNINSDFVITSVIKEPRKTKTVVKNIIDNLESMNLLWENHQLINKYINADLVIDNPIFNSIPKDSEMTEDSKSDNDRFMQYSKSKLISRENAIQLLNDTNNN